MGIFGKIFKTVTKPFESAGKSVYNEANKVTSNAEKFIKNRARDIGRKAIQGVRYIGDKTGVSKYLGDIKKTLLDPIASKTLGITDIIEKELSTIPYANEILNKITIDPRINALVDGYKLRKKIINNILKNDYDGVSNALIDHGLDPKIYLPVKVQYALHINERKDDINVRKDDI